MVRQPVIRFGNKFNLNFRNDHFNSLYACGEFCRLLMIFAKSGLAGYKQFDTLIMFLKDIYEKVNFEKKSADDKEIISQHA